MLHCVHQLVSNCVCLLFAAEQVVYSWFLELFSQPKATESSESEPNQVKLQLGR